MAGLRRVVALLVGAAVVVAGCDSSSPAGSLPSSFARPPVSATPFVAQPMPPAQVGTWEGAIEFVRHFWALYNYAIASYDIDPLEAISDPKCAYCKSVIEDVEDLQAAGSRVEGFENVTGDGTAPEEEITTGTLVIMNVNQRPGRSIRRSGKVVPLPGTRGTIFYFSVAWDGAAWRVEGVDWDKKSGKPW